MTASKTWKEIKDAVEAQGVTDDSQISYIHIFEPKQTITITPHDMNIVSAINQATGKTVIISILPE